MKKFLSILLVLAMAISCVSMITVNAGTTAVKGMTVEWNNNSPTYANYFKTAAGYLTTKLGYAADYTGKVKVAYAVTNMGTSNIMVEHGLQAAAQIYAKADAEAKSTTWATPDGKYSTVTVKPGESKIVSYTLNVVNGKVNGTYTDKKGEAQDIALANFFLRFSFKGEDTTAHKVLITSLGEKADTETADLIKGASNGTTDTLTLGTAEVAAKTVKNGDAELGTADEFFYKSGSKVTAVTTEKKNGTYSFEYDATAATSKYNYALFDLTPAVANVPAMGYNGGGVGEYTVEFYAKSTVEGTAQPSIVFGGMYRNAGDMSTLIEGTADNKANYVTAACIGSSITLGTEWQKYSVNIKVTEAVYNQYVKYLTTIADAKGNAVDMTKIGLRLDGSSGTNPIYTATDYKTAKYYLDDITITKMPDATPTPTAPAYVATQLTIKDSVDSAFFCTADGYLTDTTTNGTISKKFTIYNTGSVDYSAEIKFQTFHNGGWYGPATDNLVKVPAGRAVEYVASLPVADGKVDVKGTKYAVADFFARLNVQGTNLNGAVIVVAPEDGLPVATTFPTGSKPRGAKLEVVGLTELPQISLAKGVKVTVASSCTDPAKRYQIMTSSNGGYLNDVAITNGTLTKTYTFYNTSNVPVTVYAALQATTKKTGGSDTWAGPASADAQNTPFTLAAGESCEFNFTLDVADGMVEIPGCESRALSAFFLRFDVEGYKAGDTFVYADADAPKGLSTGLSKSTCELVYELPEKNTPAPTAIPTPAPKKELVNGDAEGGNTNGWTTFSSAGGSVEVANEGANGTAHSIKFNVGGYHYDSIGFNLAPAIVQNPQAGYYGEGAGAYKITFWAKAETGKGGLFGFVLNSQCHRSASQIGSDFTGTPVGSYISFTTGTVTDTWQQYTTVVEVNQNFLDELNFLYETTDKKACDLILRLDGSDTKAFNKGANLFNYYVDEVTIEKMDVKITNAANDGALTVVSGAVAKDANTFYTTKYATVLLKYNGNDSFKGIVADGTKNFDRRDNNTAYISVGTDDVNIVANVDTIGADEKHAVFHSATGAVIGDIDFTFGADVANIPAAPARKGMTFTAYKLNGVQYADAAALAAAMDTLGSGSYVVSLVYSASGNYTVTINDTADATINGAAVTTKDVEPFQLVKVSAPAEKDGQKFHYWADENDEPVSTFVNYSFYVIDHNVTLKPVYDAGEVPVVNYLEITTAEKNGDDSLTMIAERAFDSKVTLKANGIMFIESDNNDMSKSELETQFSNLYNGAAVVGGKKVTSKYTNRLGSYVLTKKTTTVGKTYYVCAWATYLDKDGNEQVMLSNVKSTEGANVEINFITVG